MNHVHGHKLTFPGNVVRGKNLCGSQLAVLSKLFLFRWPSERVLACWMKTKPMFSQRKKI